MVTEFCIIKDIPCTVLIFCRIAIVRAARRFSIMEGRREDTFYTELRREWRSGSIAVMADSFKTLPGIVSWWNWAKELKVIICPVQTPLHSCAEPNWIRSDFRTTLAWHPIQTAAYRVSILSFISYAEKEISLGPIPFFSAIIGHLHDGVILLLWPESFSFFLSYLNSVIPVTFK